MERLIGDRIDACRAALEGFYGRPAHEFAERANGLLARMVDLHLVLAETARLLHRFTEDRFRWAGVLESAPGQPGVRPPRVEPAAGPPSRIGADLDALRRYGRLAGAMDEPPGWLGRANDLDEVSAWQERAGGGFFDTVERTLAAAVPGVEVPVEWERIDPAGLLPLPDLRPLLRDIRARSQATAELAFATAEAFERADAELVALLERHPDLAGYVSSALGPRRMGGGAALAVVAAHFPKLDALRDGRRSGEGSKAALAQLAGDPKVAEYLRDAARRLRDSPALLEMVAGAGGVLTRRDVLRHLADMRAYRTVGAPRRLRGRRRGRAARRADLSPGPDRRDQGPVAPGGGPQSGGRPVAPGRRPSRCRGPQQLHRPERDRPPPRRRAGLRRRPSRRPRFRREPPRRRS